MAQGTEDSRQHETVPAELSQFRAVRDFYELARERMERAGWDYFDSGAMDELSLAANERAFRERALVPRVLRDVSTVDTRQTLFDATLRAPILVAPTAFHKLAHPDGEVGAATAAAQCGAGFVLSTLSTTSLETVAQAEEGPRWMQLYVHRDHELTMDLVRRAEAAGYSAICVTVDAPELGRRERDAANSFSLPDGLTLANLVSEGSSLSLPRSEGSSGLFDYFKSQIDPSLNWERVAALKSETRLPIIVKGVVHPDDVAAAEELGLDAVIISNHGGRQLDTSIDTISALARITSRAKPSIPLLMDGGVRRGTDVLKAIALGADAVLVGRPILWGLAVAGTAGAHRVLEILIGELEHAMRLSGAADLASVTRDLVAE